LVIGFPHNLHFSEKSSLCEACILGKHSRKNFPCSISKSAKTLELIHSDIWGPSQVNSNGGNRYFITFIDDYSRKVWVYILKQKSDALETFIKFKRVVELESQSKIKILRTDGGGEYMSKRFNSFCETEGIQHQSTVPHTPQQNGISERKNRVLVELARSMLTHMSVPKSFWAEAVSTAAYILNRIPSKSIGNSTPDEKYYNHKPLVSHLRVFGCRCYVHIPKETRQKLDDKSRKCVFIGYSSEKKGYKCWDPISGKVIFSRDVIFSERESYYKEQGSSKDDEKTTVEKPVEIEGEKETSNRAHA